MRIGQYVIAEQCFVMVISMDAIHAMRYVIAIEENNVPEFTGYIAKKWYGYVARPKHKA